MSRNFEDFDEKNIEIAKMLINGSEKITIDEKTNEKIIKSIRNGRKKKFTGTYKMATAVAACIVLVAGMTIWNHVNTKEGYKSSSEKMYADNYVTPSKINKNVQDTILERLNMNIAGRWNDSSLSLTLMKSTIKFVPVIDSPSRLYLVNDSEKVFRIPEKFACFYGQNDNGETIYFYAIYHAENFMKDTNPKSYYQGYVEVFGKEAADKMVESSIKRTEAERWEIMSFTPQKNETKKFEYAREHSDDGTFFILTRENTYPHICFFKDKKPYYCWGANQDELSMEPLENYLKP